VSGHRVVAALGSSFAAGPGIAPVVDAPVGRSGRNYPHRLAELLGARLVDLTASGATTANLLDTPQQLLGGSERAPQVEGVPADADVVTVTAGGNDLQFSAALLLLAWQHHRPASPLVATLAATMPHGVPAPTEDAVEAAAAGLARVVEQTRRRAPSARVLLVDYLTVIDEGSAAATPFTGEELHQLLALQRAVGAVFTRAADLTGADLVLASTLSARHALGSAEPWVQPFHPALAETAGSFHPDADGMAAVAAEVARVLGT
jgi:lysophospholipase L1-like esterase